MKSIAKNYTVGVRFWIEEHHGHFLGNGRVQLLEHIQKTGSITAGAKAMQMSYRQAWQMVADMNKLATQPLVEKISGGRGGGGAHVTDAGQNAIKSFHKMEEKLKQYALKLSKDMIF